ncbi:hypothetical protein B9Z19DRAFT_1074902 [Tuber borchii]|uniref:Uncharacterized protein n=1 Tax=Tuber borchii TaxID=42251 RepID=A0A2T7A3X2_TUBBO|nr:hypothetical protein B9Z19DRAFT_1074902 [Tuber borchii]
MQPCGLYRYRYAVRRIVLACLLTQEEQETKKQDDAEKTKRQRRRYYVERRRKKLYPKKQKEKEKKHLFRDFPFAPPPPTLPRIQVQDLPKNPWEMKKLLIPLLSAADPQKRKALLLPTLGELPISGSHRRRTYAGVGGTGPCTPPHGPTSNLLPDWIPVHTTQMLDKVVLSFGSAFAYSFAALKIPGKWISS